MSKSIIEVRDLSKVYSLGTIGATSLRSEVERVWAKVTGKPGASEAGDFWALRNVSFDVQAGEVLGVIGRNGAGKSTLLKILSRITAPTSGEAFLRGRIASLLEVGTGFHPELTGRENVYLNGTILGMKRREITERFDEIVAFAEIDKFIDTPVKRYSSGMFVRLAFAVAAHLETDIMIIDEVLAVGDVLFQKKCIGKMSEVAGKGRTVLFVSHNLTSVSALCTSCLFLKNGTVIHKGSVSETTDLYMQERLSGDVLQADLSTVPRSQGIGSKIRMTHARIITDKPTLLFQEPLRIGLKAVANNRLKDVFFGITIFSSDFTPLMSIENDRQPLADVSPGEVISAEVVIPNPGLPPGRYLVLVGAGAGLETGLDVVQEALSFTVSPQADDISYGERKNLGLRPLASWEKMDVSPAR